MSKTLNQLAVSRPRKRSAIESGFFSVSTCYRRRKILLTLTHGWQSLQNGTSQIVPIIGSNPVKLRNYFAEREACSQSNHWMSRNSTDEVLEKAETLASAVSGTQFTRRRHSVVLQSANFKAAMLAADKIWFTRSLRNNVVEFIYYDMSVSSMASILV